MMPGEACKKKPELGPERCSEARFETLQEPLANATNPSEGVHVRRDIDAARSRALAEMRSSSRRVCDALGLAEVCRDLGI